MFRLQSITMFFATPGNLRKSQRTTLAALVWALIRQPLLAIAAMGHRWAMAQTTPAKHAIKRVDRFLGNTRIDLEVAAGDLITCDRQVAVLVSESLTRANFLVQVR